jgi:hypothetical protein
MFPQVRHPFVLSDDGDLRKIVNIIKSAENECLYLTYLTTQACPNISEDEESASLLNVVCLLLLNSEQFSNEFVQRRKVVTDL